MIRAVCDDNGRRWRVEGPGWTMQPEGELTAAEAETICRTAADALTPAPWEAPAQSVPRLPPAELAAVRERARRATERARLVLKPGDRISRRLCGGATGTFTFRHWEGDWIAGRQVADCAAINVFRVNGKPVSFDDPPTE